MKKLVVILLLSLSLFGCATTGDNSNLVAGKALLTAQQTIVNVRQAIGIPCQQKVIPSDACQEIDSIYQQSKLVYDAAVDAEIVYLTTGKLEDQETYNKHLLTLQSLAINISTIAVKYGIGGNK